LIRRRHSGPNDTTHRGKLGPRAVALVEGPQQKKKKARYISKTGRSEEGQ